jgi:hypothetical protein
MAGPRRPDISALTSAVRVLRAQEQQGSLFPAEPDDAPPLQPTDPANALALLRSAAVQRQGLWVGYVESDGRTSKRFVEPLSVEAGRVTVRDCERSDVRVLSVHRVSSVGTPVDP